MQGQPPFAGLRLLSVSQLALFGLAVLALVSCFEPPRTDDSGRSTVPDSSATPPGNTAPDGGNGGPGTANNGDANAPPGVQEPAALSQCASCHNAPVKGRAAAVSKDHKPAHWRHAQVASDYECLTCHDVSAHAGGAVRLWSDPVAHTSAFVSDGDAQRLATFCLGCHGGGRHPLIHSTGGTWQPVCTECHAVHSPATQNLSLVLQKVHNRTLNSDAAVVFAARTGPGSFEDGTGANDGICQICHTTTRYHRADGSGSPHHDAEDCTSCHEHINGFVPAGGTSCVACHSSPRGPRGKVVNADGTGGHHLAGSALTDADCIRCHDTSQHQAGTVRLWNDPSTRTSAFAVNGDPAQLVQLCQGCHSGADHPAVHTTGTGWTPACTECHELHNPASTNRALVANSVQNQTLNTDLPVVFRAATGPGSFDDGTGANDGICQICHTTTRYHRADGGGSLHHAGADCTTCHPHGNGFVPPGGTSCVGCHSTSQGPRPKIVNADGSGGHHLAGGVLTDADCVQCHDLSQHQAGAVRLWDDPNSQSSAFAVNGDPNQLVPFCQTCHGGANAPTIHTTGESWTPACTECHNPHDPNNGNLSLVLSQVHNQTLNQDFPVVFTARTGPGSFDDGVGANDGICQVCHTDTPYHTYNGNGTAHHDGADCTTCHPHGNGFIPVGGTSCVGCHSTPQGSRRAMVSEFGLASHHVAGSVTDADCRVCHEMSAHQLGHVRLRNVDDPNNATTVVTLDGDPRSNATEARKLEPFCLACHDSDGAGGAAPFSDGLMPPIANATSWAASTHKVAQMTCMGDGETFGCHSTGHGSVKTHLLAPWDANQPPVPGDPLRQEEGLCYSCHGPNGPAGDIQSQFAQPSHHKVSALEQTDGSKVECKNCHDPHVASDSTRLIDPDSGAAWAGTDEAFCLTCHDGSPPASVTFPPTAPGTGYNKAAFVGTTHSTELGPSSCRHCHAWHGSTQPALLRQNYVVADSNPYTPGGSDYAACWQCHVEERIMVQANAFDGNHEVHVNWGQAPCIHCHDVHRGFDAGEPGLIDLDYPVRHGGYGTEFIDGKDGGTAFWLNGPQTSGNCYIRCHEMDHTPMEYPRTNVTTTTCGACHKTPVLGWRGGESGPARRSSRRWAMPTLRSAESRQGVLCLREVGLKP